jgi:hypothetical protein
MMKDAILNNLTTITICGCTFLAGVGIGGAITDALNRWIVKGEKSNDEARLDRGGKEISVDGHDEQRDLGRNRSSGR